MSKRYLTTDEKRAMAAKNLARIARGMDGETPVKLMPSNMAAGPCTVCLDVAKGAHTTKTAPLPPFDDCVHPDQCACMYTIDSDRLWGD